MSFSLLASCADKDTIPENDDIILEYDDSHERKADESIDYFFSLLTEKGYSNYILAFPPEYLRGYQLELGYDDATFKEALDNATYAFHSNRDVTYGGLEYHIEYELVEEKEWEILDATDLIGDLREYCYMKTSSITNVVDKTYFVRTYGLDTEMGDIYSEETSNEVVTMLYIEGEGWYVSPTELQLP